MPAQVTIGQQWSSWAPGRRQWLLTRVTGHANGRVTLQYDARYGIAHGFDEQFTDESTMLTMPTLFRFVEKASDQNPAR